MAVNELDLATARWRKSTRSTGTSNCVAVAFVGRAVGLRDSKRPDGPVIAVPRASLAALTGTPR